MPDIYLKVTIEKNWSSQDFDFLGLKNLLPIHVDIIKFLKLVAT